MLYCESGEELEQAAQGSRACFGWGFEKPSLVEGVPVRGKGLGTG